MNEALVISNHHRKSLFFETSMQRLWSAGFQNVVIQSTGSGPWSEYSGPRRALLRVGGAIPYDQGMVNFKRHLGKVTEPVVVLVDNDLFFSTAAGLKKRVEDFLASDLDFASYFVLASSYERYQQPVTDSFVAVPDQTVVPADVYPGFVPEPHHENALLLLRGSMWNRLTEDDVSHGRKWIRALVREGAKLGAHRVTHRATHSHFAPDFFHVGALFGFNHYVEGGLLDRVNPTAFDQARLGYFLHQQQAYELWYPEPYQSNLPAFYQKAGGVQACWAAWQELIKGTIMESWVTT